MWKKGIISRNGPHPEKWKINSQHFNHELFAHKYLIIQVVQTYIFPPSLRLFNFSSKSIIYSFICVSLNSNNSVEIFKAPGWFYYEYWKLIPGQTRILPVLVAKMKNPLFYIMRWIKSVTCQKETSADILSSVI